MITNIQLVEYAKAQVGKPYWFGTFGQTATETLWSHKSAQYSKYYTASRRKTAMASHLGKKVHDCAGLIKGAQWCNGVADAVPNYVPSQDLSADSMYNQATVKGTIKTIPERIGLAVWRKGHIGVYIGNGTVVEAKGFDYGVVISKLQGSTFTHWLEIPNIEYVDDEQLEDKPGSSYTPPESVKPDLLSVALEVIAGKYGNYPQRKTLLEAKGYNYDEVQAEVNRIYNGPVESTSYKVTVREGSYLNIRSGRGTNYAVVGKLYRDNVVEVSDIQNGWAKLANRDGYISTAYIKKA